jgi:2'-5' RNA ligase
MKHSSVDGCFIGVPLALEQYAFFAEMMVSMNTLKLPVRLQQSDSPHVTLMYFGRIAEENLHELETRLRTIVAGMSRFFVQFYGLDHFGTTHAPRVAWIGTKHQQELVRLYDQLEREVGEFRERIERRPFIPHLTIARIEDPVRYLREVKTVEGICNEYTFSWQVDRITIYGVKQGKRQMPLIDFIFGVRS